MGCTAELANRPKPTRAVAIVAGVVLGLSATACGGDSPQPTTIDTPAAKSTPTTSSTPTPTPTPSQTESGRKPGRTKVTAGKLDPALASEAERFVQRFMDANDRAGRTGDFTEVKRMYADSCAECRQVVSTISAIYAKGGKLVGGEFARPKFRSSTGRDGAVLVGVDSTIGAYKIVNSSGRAVESHPAERDVSHYSVKKDGQGTWHVLSWG